MGTYINEPFSKYITDKIDTIIECGSRDCLDTIEMLNFYKPQIIYSFECNPTSVEVCKQNISGYDKIQLIDKATYSENTTIDFYMTDMEKSVDKNIGASSLLVHRDNTHRFFQKKTQVQAIRLEDFLKENGIKSVDLLCMDLQGSELHTLRGLGESIKNVKYIITEVSFKSYYNNDNLYDEVNDFLIKHGFEMKNVLDYGGFGDAIYYNVNYGN
jgi:FkbM family methyltransferase